MTRHFRSALELRLWLGLELRLELREDEGMIRGYTAQQVRDAEKPHLAAGEPLMQRAAHALAERIRALLDARPAAEAGPRVLLLVGSGDNGGDALFAGAELARAGVDVHALGVGSRMREAGRADAAAAGVRFLTPDAPSIEALAARSATPAEVAATSRHIGAASDYDVIVDGILGTGTSAGSPALRGVARELVLAVIAGLDGHGAIDPDGSHGSGRSDGSDDASGRDADAHGGGHSGGHRGRERPGPTIVAVDLPSGIDPDSGAADDAVLPADVTVTFGGIKAGLLLGEGARLAGRIDLVEIGIEAELEAMTPAIDLPDPESA